MTHVTLLNIAEGTQTITDAEMRPHSLPCGYMETMDLPDAYLQMITKADRTRGTLFVVEEPSELPEQFTRMLTLLRELTSLNYNEVLRRSGEILGRNAERLRPGVDQIRQRLRRIALAYAMRDFTQWEIVLQNEDEFGDPDGRTADAIAERMAQEDRQDRAGNVTRSAVFLNVPKHMRTATEDINAAIIRQEGANLRTSLTPDDTAGLINAQEIIGRVPTAVQRMVPGFGAAMEVSRGMPTASPGELPYDNRTPDQIEADIAAAAAFDTESAIDEDVAAGDEGARPTTTADAPAPVPGRQVRKTPAAPPSKAPARTAKSAPAKKTAKKGTKRKTR